MIAPSIPPNEAQRLSALRQMGILDTPPEERFDRITRLARLVLHMPIALVSLVDESRQWFKSRQGLLLAETPREISFCAHTILGGETFAIPDTLRDERFHDNPLVIRDPHIRFYAGHPLSATDGSRVGTLCVLDRNPRRFTEAEMQLLKDLAGIVQTELNLAGWVGRQAEELERLSQLRGYLPPQVFDLIVSSGDMRFLESHRQDICVVFSDLRGFTAFSEAGQPEEVMQVLRDYHAAVGPLIMEFEGTLEHFAGDGLMVFFNDPVPVPNPAERAIRMAVGMRQRVEDLTKGWRRRGYELDFAAGIARGYATLGQIGFEGRAHYGAIGTVPNVASRLCDEARGGQILISQRVYLEVEAIVGVEPMGDLTLKGLLKPVTVYNVVGLR